MVFYAAFNSISVKSQQQFTLFMSFLGFTSIRLALCSVLPQDTPTKKPRGSSSAETQDPWITSQTLYHCATQDPSFRIGDKTRMENKVEKRENDGYRYVLLFPQCFIEVGF